MRKLMCKHWGMTTLQQVNLVILLSPAVHFPIWHILQTKGGGGERRDSVVTEYTT